MAKLCTSKTFLKMASGKMLTSHPTPLDPPLAISYRNYQMSLSYFSHLASLVLFFFTKRQIQKGGHGTKYPLNYAPALQSKKGLCPQMSFNKIKDLRLDSL